MVIPRRIVVKIEKLNAALDEFSIGENFRANKIPQDTVTVHDNNEKCKTSYKRGYRYLMEISCTEKLERMTEFTSDCA